MPARSRAITHISRKVSDSIKTQREIRGWTMPQMSAEMYAAGYPLSPAILGNIENGFKAKDGSIRTRLLSVDEVSAFAEVLGITVEELIR